jgi:hypothetical protein
MIIESETFAKEHGGCPCLIEQPPNTFANISNKPELLISNPG